jgi:membrane fusion protein, multidrug efflux system
MVYRIRFSHVLIIALLASLFGSCGEEERAPEKIIRPVRCQKVFPTSGTRIRTFSGTARAGVESQLSFRVSGTIEEVAVEVGARVATGQLIARLDAADFELKVQETEAALTDSEAQARKAEADFKRAQALYENRNIPRNDYDAARAQAESTRAGVDASKKRLELAESQLSYTRLEAPVDGAIADVPVEVNENVQPGTPVAILTSGARAKVEVAVPEVFISRIRQGTSVTVTFDALQGKEFAATVTEVGVAATGFATTYPVTALLENTDPGIRSGMAAEVAFTFETGDDGERFTVPPVAVGEDREGRFVFVVEPTGNDLGIARRRTVTVGELTGDGLVILDGLKDGDFLVTAGVSKITDGQEVRHGVNAPKAAGEGN